MPARLSRRDSHQWARRSNTVFWQLDAESLLQIAATHRRYEEGPSVAHARDPAESKEALSECGADRAGEVGSPLAPVYAGAAENPAAVTGLFDVDAKFT